MAAFDMAISLVSAEFCTMWVQTRDELATYERSISYADWVTLAVKFNSQYLYADDRTTYTVLYVSVLFFFLLWQGKQ